MPEISPNKILKYLSLGLGVVCALCLVKEVILKPKAFPPLEIPFELPLIKIDFELLTDSRVKALLPFEQISLPKRVGRENPFEPYKLGELEEEIEEVATTTEATTTEEI